jgi:hypothetical protein
VRGAGNPRFLAVAAHAISEMAKILQLHRPDIQLNVPQVVQLDWSALKAKEDKPDEIEQLIEETRRGIVRTPLQIADVVDGTTELSCGAGR